MPKVLYLEQNQDISDVIETVRRTTDDAVALVLPENTHTFHNPFNLKLLSQFSSTSEKETSVITGDPGVQAMARDAGFATYASVQAFERGIEVVRPHDDVSLVGSAETPQPVVTKPAAVPVRKPATGGSEKRRAQVYIGVALGVIGLLLLVFVSPAATITMSVAATPVTVNPQIQGSTSPVNGQADYIQTQIESAQETQQFQATPTGTQQVAAVAATGFVELESVLPSDANTTVWKNYEFDTTNSGSTVKFSVTQNTDISVPAGDGTNYGPPSQPIPLQDLTGEAKGNVPANSTWSWSSGENPCTTTTPGCPKGAQTYRIVNTAAMSGGADAKVVTSAQDSDIQNWNTQVSAIKQQLTTKVQNDMRGKISGVQYAIDPATGNKSDVPDVACNLNPALPQSGDKFNQTQITVTCQSSGVAYNPKDINAIVMRDINAAKPTNETLATGHCTIPKPSVNQVSPDGTLALDFPGAGVTCYSTPPIRSDELKDKLTCKSPDDAKQLLQNANNRRLQNISIDQQPFGMFFLPCFSGRISLDVRYLQQAPSSTSG